METCTPSGSLAPITLSPGRCECGAALHAIPAGDEWTYVDDGGNTSVDQRPKALREDPKAWWAWLADEHIEVYSRLSAAVNLGCFSWWHIHRRAPDAGGSYDVPECHGMPMQFTPRGWRCRSKGAVFPYAGELVA